MKKLQIFDFDGTLVFTPTNTPEQMEIYEKAKGIPWLIDKQTAKKLSAQLKKPIGVRRGWFGRKETLEPPLVPDPTPQEIVNQEICDLFLESKTSEDTITVMMTGRHSGLRNHVLRILGDIGLIKVKVVRKGTNLLVKEKDGEALCYFLGDDGPVPDFGERPSETLPWKCWIIEQLIQTSQCDMIEIWEDRLEHVLAFEEFGETLDQELKVHFVEKK